MVPVPGTRQVSASPFRRFEHALDAQTDEIRIREFGTRTSVKTGGVQTVERLEKRGVHHGDRVSNKLKIILTTPRLPGVSGGLKTG